MTVRNAAAQALSAPATAVASGHVGRRAGFVDENELQRIEVELAFEPHPASLTDVGTILFARVRRLFLYVMSWRSKKRQIIDGETFSPRARSRRSQISTSVRSGSRRFSPSR
jgi:hypothetical protein